MNRTDRGVARVLAALSEKPLTRPELSDALHMSITTTFRYIHLLQDQPRRLYIKSYRRTAGCRAPVYALGNKPDAIEPSRNSRIVRRQRERASLLADDDRLDRHRAKQRISKKIVKARQAPKATWLSALGVINA